MKANDYTIRQNGNTTRSVDAIIQKCFKNKGYFVEIMPLDGYKTTEQFIDQYIGGRDLIKKEKREIFSRVCRRLDFEHPHVKYETSIRNDFYFIKIL